MSSPSSSADRCARSREPLALICACALYLLAPAGAQSDDKVATASTPQVAASSSLTISALDQAPRSQDHTIVQLRRFFDDRGGVITVREELRVDADGSDSPPYSLAFLGVEGEPAGSPLHQKWASTYSRFASVFYRHGCFRIRDLSRAQQNYGLHDFGLVVRAGRSARRIVLFPNSLDKAIWLLEVDAATFLPLYTAEYDARFRLLSEIEAISFATNVSLVGQGSSAMIVTPQPSFTAAKSFMGDPDGVFEPSSTFVGEYGLRAIEVTVNPLNNRQTLTLSYTDGVDEFFVVQSPGASDYFATLPTSKPKGGAGASPTIARYRDPSMTVLLFWDDGVGFQVSGRGSLGRLDGLAKSIFTQALMSH